MTTELTIALSLFFLWVFGFGFLGLCTVACHRGTRIYLGQNNQYQVCVNLQVLDDYPVSGVSLERERFHVICTHALSMSAAGR